MNSFYAQIEKNALQKLLKGIDLFTQVPPV